MIAALLQDDFLLRALLAGVGVALAAGPLGVFVVWRRMAYFGDTLSHAALLGVTLGLVTGLEMNLAILLVCLASALFISWLQARPTLPTDTALGILSHGALALGLVGMALAGGMRLDLMGYLFGDILAITWGETAWIHVGAVLVWGVLALIWRPLLNATVHEGLAHVDGVDTHRVRLIFMVLVALVIAVAIKIIGALLITALLIIPPAAARPWVRTPLAMALTATLIGIASVCLGLTASYLWNTPAGPSIVLTAALIFLAGLPVSHRRG